MFIKPTKVHSINVNEEIVVDHYGGNLRHNCFVVTHKHENLPINPNAVFVLDKHSIYLSSEPNCKPAFPIFKILFMNSSSAIIHTWEFLTEVERDQEFDYITTLSINYGQV